MKKRTVLILLMAALLLLVTSCKEGDGVQTETPSTEAETQAAPLKLVENGEAQYAVLLPADSTGAMREAVNSFADKLSELYGVKFEVKKNKKIAGDTKLIAVGVPEDLSYAEYFGDVGYGEYEVKLAKDGNVVIAAWSLNAINDSCTKFYLKLKKAYEAGDTSGTLGEDVLLKGKDTDLLDFRLPHFSLTKMPRVFRVSGARGAYELLYKNTEAADTDSYRKTLLDAGFELVQERAGDGNSFFVYRSGEVEVTVDYFGKTKELAVIVDKPKTTASLTLAPSDAVTVPKLIEPGLEYDGALKGMCYVLQASDGSYVIIDGGDGDAAFVERLYSVLKENAPEGKKPHVRAWFVTHAHGDHMGGLIDLASGKYASLIECDAIYSNMPYEGYQSAYDKSTYLNRIANLEKAANNLGANMVTARTGQTCYFADIELCIIGSVDDMFLTDYSDLDQTSLVMTVKVGSKKLIFSGDAGPVYIGQYINKRYTAQTLKCDIVQATSHGQNGDALADYYKMTDADVYLWPATKEFYNKHTPNKYIQSDTSAKIVYSYDGQYIAELN